MITQGNTNVNKTAGVIKMENDKLTLTVEETAKCLGIGRNSAYEAVARGEIPVIKVGKRLLVPKAALEKLLNCNQTKTAEPS
jgi:excisionase family DNA binding protein